MLFRISCWILALADVGEAQKIAIIGGGISGSFTAKYLTDFDSDCKIQTITVFEPYPATEPIKSTRILEKGWQGSRVTSLQLDDGSFVELGASVGYKGFHLVLEMIGNDASIEIGAPFNTGKPGNDENLRDGMGIYEGAGRWPLLTSLFSKSYRKFQILGRYNWDLLKMSRICQQAEKAIAAIPRLLRSRSADTFFESPDDIWNAVGLSHLVHTSFDEFLNVLGLPKDVPWWRKYLPYQGSLRSELLTAINLVNYNQDNSQVNGLVGLGSFAPTSGGLFSVVGGNYKIIKSAFDQAKQKREASCAGTKAIEFVETNITVVLGSPTGFDLYAGDEIVGKFDSVVLAAPLQMSKIKFLIKSHMDEAVIQDMPLAGLLNAHGNSSREGHPFLPSKLPASATRSYTQVVTTVVSNATLNAEYFSVPETNLPRSIMMTKNGKHLLHNITAITQVSSAGVFKMFSDKPLEKETLELLFGPYHRTEYVKVWGGIHGGATPDYQGQGESLGFLLYNNLNLGGLYYPLAMEQSSLACMEMSATGAYASAKLIARQLNLVSIGKADDKARDEL